MRLRLIAVPALLALGLGADSLESRVDVYDDGLVTAVMPSLAGAVDRGNWTVAFSTSVDGVSGATPLLTVDGVSGATTFDEVRGAGLVGLTYRPAKTWTTSAAASWSSESDDTTQGLSLGATTELLGRTATLGGRAQLGRRTTTRAGGGAPIDRASSIGLDAVWSQVLTRSLVLDLRASGRHDACGGHYGCNANPYRQVPLVADTVQGTLGERHPRSRTRAATGLRLALALGDRTGVHLGLRTYTDSWRMTGHTATAKLARMVASERLLLAAQLRGSLQAPASFYLDDYRTPPDTLLAPTWRTADRELAGMQNLAIGGRARWTFDNVGPFLHLGVSARVMRMWFAYPDYTELPRRSAWVVGGGLNAEL